MRFVTHVGNRGEEMNREDLLRKHIQENMEIDDCVELVSVYTHCVYP